MADLLYAGSHQQKSQYIRDKVSALAADCFPPQTKVSLVEFDTSCRRCDLSEIQDGALTKLSGYLADDWGGGGTEFSLPLTQAVEILRGDYQSAANMGVDVQESGVRSLVFFLTDGQDERTLNIQPIVEQIRNLNAMTFICGIGESYDMKRIREIASHAGASTWSHVPLENGAPDVFDVQIPNIVRQLISEDHYIKIRAQGDFTGFTAMSPSIRDVPAGKHKIYSGYTGLSTGLLFEKRDNLTLTLHAGRHVGDRSSYSSEIPITDIADAGALFERAREGEALLERYLVLQALQNRDVELLKAMMKVNPSLEASIAPAIEDMLRYPARSDCSTHGIHSAMSVTGYTGHSRRQANIETGRAGPDITRFGSSPPQQLDKKGAQHGQPDSALHSGWLGPLDQSAPSMSIPAAKKFSPARYDDIQPHQELAPSIDIPVILDVNVAGVRQKGPISLLGLLQKQEYVFGRAPDSPNDGPNTIRVQLLRSEKISRSHFTIIEHDGRYWISDLDSRNGTYLNGTELTPHKEYELAPGSEIGLAGCSMALQFKGPARPKM
jgi:hypothetical protein